MKCFKNLILIRIIGLLLFILSFSFFYSITQAVTVGPVKLEINADPGDVVTGELFLMNEEKKGTKIFYPDFQKFIEEGGSKKFIAEKSDLATWFEIDYPVTLNSLEGKNIPFTLRVPKDASPGGHFAVIWWSASSPEAGQVSIVTRAGILVYLTVSGEIKEEGQVLEFTTQNKKKFFGNPPINFAINFENSGNVHLKPKGEIQIKNIFGETKAVIDVNKKDLISGEIKEQGQILEFTTQNKKKFFGNPPINFAINFENTGNVHLKPKGEIQIKNIFGGTKAIIDVNKKDMSILPQSRKTLNEEWNFSGFVFGPYKANLKLVYGDTQKKVEQSFWIVIIPWKKLLILVLIIVLVFFGIPKGLKKYNQWIVDKYKTK